MELTADTLNTFQNVLPSNFFNKISEVLGLPLEKTKSTMARIIPTIFNEVQNKIGTPAGIQSVASAIKAGGFDNPAALSSDKANITSQINKGQDTLNRVLGGRIDPLLRMIATTTEVNSSTANKLLGAASTAVFCFMGSKMKNGNLNMALFNDGLTGVNLASASSTINDANPYTARAVPLSSSPTVSSEPVTKSKVWPWFLLAVVIGIIWWSQGRNPAPVLAPTATTAYAQTDQTILSEFRQFLANPAAAGPRTFTFRELDFATGSAVLTTAANSTVNEIAALMQQYPTLRIRIIGHTDNAGQALANTQLSTARAENLRAALVSQNIQADRIIATGMGSDQPVGNNNTDEGRTLNRRIDIEVVSR